MCYCEIQAKEEEKRYLNKKKKSISFHWHNLVFSSLPEVVVVESGRLLAESFANIKIATWPYSEAYLCSVI